MEWIKIPDTENVRKYLPKDKVFLALWKGQFCLADYDEEIDRFWLQMLPGTYEYDMQVPLERERKFTHYCNLELPKDYY